MDAFRTNAAWLGPARLLSWLVRRGEYFQATGSKSPGLSATPKRDAAFVAALSGLMGIFLGMATGWQVAVESAQVVAGIVQYPLDNPFAMYHQKTWTLLHQIPAALLVMGVPERILAMLVGGLAGMISFQALALCAYAAGARRLLAAMTPLLLLGSLFYIEVSNIYPVRVLSNAPWVLYGCVGTSLAVLTWSLIGVGARRWGALLMGLAPAVHPTLGAWCLAVGGLAFLWNWRGQREVIRSSLGWLLAGLAITGTSLVIHLCLSRHLPDISQEEKAHYVAAFAANWDSHRKPFPMDHVVLVMAGLAVAICGLWLRFFPNKLTESSRFLLRAMFLSGTLSVGLCVATQWQEHLPTLLLMAMPGRFINVVALAFPALCLGLLCANRPTLLGHLMVAGLACYLLGTVQRFEIGRIYVPWPGIITMACSMALLSQVRQMATPAQWRGRGAWLLRSFHGLGPLGLAALATNAGLESYRQSTLVWSLFTAVLIWRRPRIAAYHNACLAGWLDLATTVCLWSSAALVLGWPFTVALLSGTAAVILIERGGLPRSGDQAIGLLSASIGWRRVATASLAGFSVLAICVVVAVQAWLAHLEMPDGRNDLVYRQAARGSGMLLTASTIRATQLRTRRPVLLEGPALNQLPYVPESGPSMNRILQRVYGEDLFRPRPAGWLRGGGLARNSGRALWEKRTPEQWQTLAREFGFTQIVTYSTWKLNLPVVARTKKLLLYEIPGAETQWR